MRISLYFLIYFFLPLSFLTAELTLEEKVGQLLLVHFNGEIANDSAKTLLEKAHVGGFIYYRWSNTLSSPYQVQTLSLSLQKMNHQLGNTTPLFIAIDQEGGRINRLKSGFTEFPAPSVISEIGILDLETRVSKAIGIELSKVGINMNLAPVVDVNCNPHNVVIGDRSFSDDPIQVAEWGKAALQGYKESQIISVLKHFPGHGDVHLDSHIATPIVKKEMADLEAQEFYPFATLAKEADAIMTAHVILPALDPKNPATFSKTILSDLLRDKMQFEGVIICDSLVMKGLLTCASSYEEAAILALKGGCDLLCLGGKLLDAESQDEITVEDVIRIHRAIVDAVKIGVLSLSDIDRSVERINHLKSKYPLSEWKTLPLLTSNQSVSSEDHVYLLKEIQLLVRIKGTLIKESLTLIGNAIWKNECNRSLEGLISWNKGENFLSLGIGHFIWYPSDVQKDFDEGFPKFLAFAKKKKIVIPEILQKGAPWHTREEFLNQKNSETYQQMMVFLTETIDLQMDFMCAKLFLALDQIFLSIPSYKFPQLRHTIEELSGSPQGIFALVDYLNFKGDGLSLSERYEGKGWGLSQVLEQLPKTSAKTPLERFQMAAIQLLTQRVENSPEERGENRWLPGWKNRINNYKSF